MFPRRETHPVQRLEQHRVVRQDFNLVPVLHHALCIVDEEDADEDPEHECHERHLDHLLQVGRVQPLNIHNVEQGRDEYDVSTLAQQFLEWLLKRFVKFEERSVRLVKLVVDIGTAALRRKLHDQKRHNYDGLPAKLGDRILARVLLSRCLLLLVWVVVLGEEVHLKALLRRHLLHLFPLLLQFIGIFYRHSGYRWRL